MFRNILAAIDGSTHSARAVAEAADLATAGSGSLTLISVGVPPRIWPSAYMINVSDSELEHAAQSVVDEAAAAVPDEISVSKVVRVGRPADEIVATANAREQSRKSSAFRRERKAKAQFERGRSQALWRENGKALPHQEAAALEARLYPERAPLARVVLASGSFGYGPGTMPT